MTYRGQETPIFDDFSGGQNSNSPPRSIAANQGSVIQNMIIMPNGRGLRTRLGDAELNSSAMNSGATVTALQYYQQADSDEFLMAFAGDKGFKMDSTGDEAFDGTFDDITGGQTITAGNANTWTSFVAEDEVVFVGGAPDAPLKWTGTGNLTTLGGSPPSGSFGFYHNNRAFIGGTSANPSRIQWSILANIEDWSGQGSGSQDVLTNDGSTLLNAAILNTDVVLLFKQTSIHKMITRTAPFPVYPLFRNIGAAGKHAIVTVDGIAYFITQDARMAITDGSQIIDVKTIPRLNDVNNLWDGLNKSRLSSIYGILYEGLDFRHIVWTATDGAGTTNDIALVWDLDHGSWLHYPKGYAANVMATTKRGKLYGGHYDGKVYEKDKASTYTDASNSSNGVKGVFKTGWIDFGSLESIKHVEQVNLALRSETAGDVNVRVGADYSERVINNTVNIQSSGGQWGVGQWGVMVWGGEGNFIGNVLDVGVRGNNFLLEIDGTNTSVGHRVNGFSFSGDIYHRKEFLST